jgi:hypothetical protein
MGARRMTPASTMTGRTQTSDAAYAVQLKLPCAQHIARVADGDEEEHLYRCVRELARMVRVNPASWETQ